MIFFDSYAIIEVINGNEKFRKYADSGIVTNLLNLSEVFYALLLRKGFRTADYLIKRLNFEFVDITEEIVLKAACFRFDNKKRKLSYADCIGYVCAIENGMKFLTGDKEFKNFKGVEFVGR